MEGCDLEIPTPVAFPEELVKKTHVCVENCYEKERKGKGEKVNDVYNFNCILGMLMLAGRV